MLLAVLAQRAGISTANLDVWVTVAGGVRATEPAADLGVALAVVSAITDVPIPGDLVVCGEVGLAGELRQVGRIDRRLAERSEETTSDIQSLMRNSYAVFL